MAMLGCGCYLCEACKHFDTDGNDGNHPRCGKQSIWSEHHLAVRIGERCPYGFEVEQPPEIRLSFSGKQWLRAET